MQCRKKKWGEKQQKRMTDAGVEPAISWFVVKRLAIGPAGQFLWFRSWNCQNQPKLKICCHLPALQICSDIVKCSWHRLLREVRLRRPKSFHRPPLTICCVFLSPLARFPDTIRFMVIPEGTSIICEAVFAIFWSIACLRYIFTAATTYWSFDRDKNCTSKTVCW